MKAPRYRIFCLLILFSLLAMLAGCAQLIARQPETELRLLRPGHYQLDPRHTRVLFKVSHLGLSKFVGRFNQVDAVLDFDPENISSAKLDALVGTASIDVNDADLESSLSSHFWLNSNQFPQAEFSTSSVERTDGGLQILGELTLLGVTRPLILQAVLNGGAFNLLTGKYTIGFEAHGKLLRSDYGLSNYIPAVGDEVELEIHAEFQRR